MWLMMCFRCESSHRYGEWTCLARPQWTGQKSVPHSHCCTCCIIAVSLQVKATILSTLVRCWLCWGFQLLETPSQFTTPHHNRFTALFPGPSGWAGARRELLDFMVQGEINTGRHTDHPAERHSIRINQCPPPPSPYFLQAGCPSCRPTNSVKALKATSAFVLGRRR